MPATRLIRIGTRSSPMALAQVERVRAELRTLLPDVRTEVLPMTTSGDRWSGPLSALGGKGAFTKEVDAALLAGACDLAVHCMKDVPGDRPVPAGTVFAAYLARDDIRDALVHPGGLALAELALLTCAGNGYRRVPRALGLLDEVQWAGRRWVPSLVRHAGQLDTATIGHCASAPNFPNRGMRVSLTFGCATAISDSEPQSAGDLPEQVAPFGRAATRVTCCW